MLLQAVGQVDALAILVQPHQHCHGAGGDAADAQVYGIDQPVETVGGVQFTADQLIAQVGPGRLALEVECEAVRLGEALGGGDHQRGAIGQGHEPKVQAALFRGIAAVYPSQRIVHQYLPFLKKKRRFPGWRYRPLQGNDAFVRRPVPPLVRA